MEKASAVLLGEAIARNSGYIEICLSENIPVFCINRKTKSRKPMPFKAMYEHNKQFWLHNKTWEYYISSNDLKKIQELALNNPHTVKPEHDIEPIAATEGTGPLQDIEERAEIIDGFGEEYDVIAAVPDSERAGIINKNSNRLQELIDQKPEDKNIITEALVETTKETMLHNRAALLNAMVLADDAAKEKTRGLVISMKQFVRATTQLISSNVFNDDLMTQLVSQSNGTIIQHMLRVYLNGLAFLIYYNDTVSSSSMINKLRANFNSRYKNFYRSFLPHLDDHELSLERVFMGGMRAISEEQLDNWAMGFLMHDLGKASAVKYHEGDDEYDRQIVVEHVKVGYHSIINKTTYPREAGLITGYHHEYYGNPKGYGYFRSYLNKYKEMNPHSVQGYCIALDLKPVIDCEALAYFPAKILEIIDVFDSITDPSRKYRDSVSTKDALTLMLKEFIIKEPKLDLILFDIFAKFVGEMSIQ